MLGRHRSRRLPRGAWPAAAAVLAFTACALTLAAPASAQTLTSLTVPTISTQPLVGNTVSASTGTWSETGLTYTYQWYDCDPNDPTSCGEIPGATGSTYSPQAVDGGFGLEVAVVATDGGGNTAGATSAESDAVVAAPGATVPETAPTIGPAVVGQTVTGTLGTWTGSPTSYTEQWLACAPDESDCQAAPCPDASTCPTPTTYVPSGAVAGAVLVFVVTASNAFGESIDAYSDPSTTITDPPPTIQITSPANGASFAVGSAQTAQYSCSAADGTPAAECGGVDSTGAEVDSGDPIDTSQPGQYTITVTAVDYTGVTATATVTYTVTGAAPSGSGSSGSGSEPGGGSASGAALALTGLRESASRWRLGSALPSSRTATAAPPLGTVFVFTASAPAQVTYAFTRRLAGRTHDGRCVAPADAGHHARSCTRTQAAGSMTLGAAAGADRVEFDGRLSASEQLVPGTYTAHLTAHAVGSTKTVNVGRLRFTIVG